MSKLADSSEIRALLGPTNTGKTHRAIERMLEHESGMIGLPLRLLAREVYERVSTRVGENQVALVTGEEKRIPKRPRYWVATVEAMPLDREVDFLAVDEIQLAAHPERGHVFTDRLLHARGLEETWLLGAATMKPLVSELVPTASFVEHPRLSSLRWVGATKLSALPPRSAVVAFSMSRVIELAERIRAKRGGAAVVVGALSPRARNAQVAMYQAGEVDHLVATDAIGMGLNLDLDHVAFADLRKYDGREARPLDASEIAQVAGRAGRYTRDGSFGTLAPLPPLGESMVRALEAHELPPVRRLSWRNAELDLDSAEGLVASLRAPPSRRALSRVEYAEDQAALEALLRRPEVRARALRGPEIALLWAVAQIPDYRQLLFEDHVAFLARLYLELVERGRVDEAWMLEALDRVARSPSDVDSLMARVAELRLYSYVAHQGDWVEASSGARERAVEVEDQLSDALHEALVLRFVDRSARLPRGPRPSRSQPGAAKAPPARGSAPKAAPSSPFAVLASMRDAMAPAGAMTRSGSASDPIERAIEASFDELEVDASGRICFEGTVLARFTSGRELCAPELAVLLDLDAGARSRLTRRLVAFGRDLVNELVGPLRELAPSLGPAGRGLVHALSSRLGSLLAGELRPQLDALDAGDRAALERVGVYFGQAAVYLPSLLKPLNVTRRAALASGLYGGRDLPRWPSGAEASVAPRRDVEPALYAAVGYLVVEGRAYRADLVERVAGRIARAELGEADDAKIAGWLGCKLDEARRFRLAFAPPAETAPEPALEATEAERG